MYPPHKILTQVQIHETGLNDMWYILVRTNCVRIPKTAEPAVGTDSQKSCIFFFCVLRSWCSPNAEPALGTSFQKSEEELIPNPESLIPKP